MELSNEDRVLEGVSIDQYYNEHIVPLERKFRPMIGQKPTGICPFHEDTDPSLSYWKEKKIYYCFGCRATGDVIKMHQEVQKIYHKTRITRKEAMESLAQMYRIELAKDELGNIIEENIFEKGKQSLKVVNNKKGKYTINQYIEDNKRLIENDHIRINVKKTTYKEIDLMYYTDNVDNVE